MRKSERTRPDLKNKPRRARLVSENLSAALTQTEINIAALRRYTHTLDYVGFGICNAAQVRAVVRVADGVIVGSAIICRIDQAIGAGANTEAIVAVVTEFLAELTIGLAPSASTC